MNAIAADGTPAGSGTGQDLVNGLGVATLTAVLQYHVVGDARHAQAVLASSQIVMPDGNAAAMAVKSGRPYIQNARISNTDIQASNGIVHVVDAVLLPPSLAGAQRSSQTIAAFDEAAKQLDYCSGLELVEKLDLRTLTAALTYHVICPKR